MTAACRTHVDKMRHSLVVVDRAVAQDETAHDRQRA